MTADKTSSGGARVLPFEPARTAAGRCPLCSKPARKETRPFCSRHCANIDLGHWLDGNYRIPTEERPESAEGARRADEFEE